MDFEEMSVEDEEKKLKKKKIEEYKELPKSALDGFDKEIAEELQYCYEILQVIFTISRIEPFLEKPDSNLFGLSTYYTKIKTPMWLNEIDRKLMQRMYKGIREFVGDIRLMLENCYRFWGSSHKFTKVGLRIEQKLEQMIDSLPECIKTKCVDTDGCVAVVAGSQGDDVEEDNIFKGFMENETTLPFKSSFKIFQSKLLNRALESEANDTVNQFNSDSLQIREEEMLAWERGTLVTEDLKEQMKAMWQLAEVGHFLKLAGEVLNVEEITQYEIERMLIMPRESSTLATLMTSLLSPQGMRSSLDITPVMPYEIWTTRLKKRVEDWFNIFYRKCNFFETYKVCGIDPHFWCAMCLQNPLDDKKFHELTFYQRSWIMKSLCNNLFHTNKCVQDLFCDGGNPTEWRQTNLGQDTDGCSYFHLPFIPEIRIYKQRTERKGRPWAKYNFTESVIFSSFDRSVCYHWDECGELTISPNQEEFYTVADSLESVNELSNKLKDDSLSLSRVLLRFSKEAQKCKPNLEGLDALYNQWCGFQKRTDVDEKKTLEIWECDNSYNPVADKNEDVVQEVFEVLGKRRIKSNVRYTDMEMTSSDYEVDDSDVSDWEESNLKKKKKGKKKQVETTESGLDKSIDSFDEKELLKITEEITVSQDIKPDIIKEDTLEINSDIDVKPVEIFEQVKNATTLLVPILNEKELNPPKEEIEKPKEETEKPKEKEDVISISSEDEVEIQPYRTESNSTNTSVNQLIVMPQPIPSTPQKTPPVKKWPKPIPVSNIPPPQQIITPTNSPGNINYSPRARSPQIPLTQSSGRGIIINRSPLPVRGRGNYTPRQRSPSVVSPQGVSPRLSPSPRASIVRGTLSPRIPSRNLFQTNPRQQGGSQFPEPKLEGILEIGQSPDGTFGYQVRLPDGGVIQMKQEEVNELRRKNNNILPTRVAVPRVKKPIQSIL